MCEGEGKGAQGFWRSAQGGLAQKCFRAPPLTKTITKPSHLNRTIPNLVPLGTSSMSQVLMASFRFFNRSDPSSSIDRDVSKTRTIGFASTRSTSTWVSGGKGSVLGWKSSVLNSSDWLTRVQIGCPWHITFCLVGMRSLWGTWSVPLQNWTV